MRALAVIGAAMGDEGKGRMVDAFAAKRKSAIVVRYNGGGQAAHTVVTPEGKGHVFRHVGAGSMAGADTYLSRFFIVNPLLWKIEHEELDAKGVQMRLYVHPDAIVSTPYDMLINREIERLRGDKRHGTCGYGINETVTRFLGGKHRLRVFELAKPDVVADVLRRIRDTHVPARLMELGIKKTSDVFQGVMESDKLLQDYMEGVQAFMAHAVSLNTSRLQDWPNVIFEGAQGLLLDEQHAFFPHVTRSRTGLPNIAHICREAKIMELEAVYTMRAYMTRHGYGPLPTEDKAMSFADATNKTNEWQGGLRFGRLDLDLISAAIQQDSTYAAWMKVTRAVAVTCLDQVPEVTTYRYKNEDRTISRDGLGPRVAQILKARQLYVSCGVSRLAKTGDAR